MTAVRRDLVLANRKKNPELAVSFYNYDIVLTAVHGLNQRKPLVRRDAQKF
jgi:hypothetical protein